MKYKGYDIKQIDNNNIWISKQGKLIFLCEYNRVLSDTELEAVVNEVIKFTVELRELFN